MLKLTLIPITLSELKPLIRYSYEGDTGLIEKYQADTTRTLEQCVDFNFEEICTHIKTVYNDQMKLWKIAIINDEGYKNVIGYCVTAEHENDIPKLFSFAINQKYRTKEILTDWLQAVEEKLKLPYHVILWNQNTRAINFFKKNNFSEFGEVNEKHSIFIKTEPPESWQ